MLVRADTGGASRAFVDTQVERRTEFSIGFQMRKDVRTVYWPFRSRPGPKSSGPIVRSVKRPMWLKLSNLDLSCWPEHQVTQRAFSRLRQQCLLGGFICPAQDLIAFTQDPVLEGDLATTEPGRLRYSLHHTAAQLTSTSRKTTLRFPGECPGRGPWLMPLPLSVHSH